MIATRGTGASRSSASWCAEQPRLPAVLLDRQLATGSRDPPRASAVAELVSAEGRLDSSAKVRIVVRECETGQLNARGDPELAVDVPDVGVDRVARQEELLGAQAEHLASTVEQVAVLSGNRSLLNGLQLVRGLAALGVEARELRAAGQRPRHTQPDGWARLSAQEP
jgi:hypothetical protein